MNSLANEMTAKAIVKHRLESAEAARNVAAVRVDLSAVRGRTPLTLLREAAGRRIETFGRRLAGSPEPAATDRGC